MLLGQAEATAPEEFAAGRMRDRASAGCDPKLARYVSRVAVYGELADHGRGLRRYPRAPLRRHGRRGRLWYVHLPSGSRNRTTEKALSASVLAD